MRGITLGRQRRRHGKILRRQRPAKERRAMAAIATTAEYRPVLNPKQDITDYRMHPRRPSGASTSAVRPGTLRLECLFPHVLALQRAAGGRLVDQPALLDVWQAAPRQVPRGTARAAGQSPVAPARSGRACNLDSRGFRGRSAGSQRTGRKSCGGVSPATGWWFQPPRPPARSWPKSASEKKASSTFLWTSGSPSGPI